MSSLKLSIVIILLLFTQLLTIYGLEDVKSTIENSKEKVENQIHKKEDDDDDESSKSKEKDHDNERRPIINQSFPYQPLKVSMFCLLKL